MLHGANPPQDNKAVLLRVESALRAVDA